MNNSVIITGNKGFIGKFLHYSLMKLGFKVIGFDKENNLQNENIVQQIMNDHSDYFHLINAFAINDHVKIDKKTNSALTSPLSEFKEYLDVNVTSLYSVCREFIKTREQGNIINFSSIYGLISPDPKIYETFLNKEIGYPVSKNAVIGLSNYLAVNYAPNFKVNTLALGGIINNQSKPFVDKYSKKVPMNRMMNIEEILPTILLLLNEKNTYMTGSLINIDGGYSII